MRKRIESFKGGGAFLLSFALSNIVGAIAMAIAGAVISATKGIDLNTAMTDDVSLFVGLFVMQIMMFVTTLIFTKGTKEIKSICAINLPKKKLDFLFAGLLSLGLVFGLSILPTLFMMLLGEAGYTPTPSPIPNVGSPTSFIVGLFVICLFPAIGEELLFRGVILTSLGSVGKWFAIIFSGFLFMLMHASPMQTVYQFALGIIFGIVAVYGKSIILTMFMHFLNNFIAILLEKIGIGEQIPLIVIVVGLVLVVISLIYFLKKKGSNEFIEEENDDALHLSIDQSINNIMLAEKRREKSLNKILTIVLYGVGILLCVANWILMFIEGLAL